MERSVEALLAANPRASVDEMLQCADLLPRIRASSDIVVAALTRNSNIHRLHRLIAAPGGRRSRDVYVALLDVNCAALVDIFRRSIPQSEYALSCLDMRTPDARFAAGLVLQSVSRAFFLWAPEVRELFRLSKKVFPLLIRNIDEPSVFHFVSEVIGYSCENATLLLWHCFAVMTGYRGEKPPVAHMERELNLRVQLTKSHKKSIIKLLQQYFAARSNRRDCLDAYFMGYIAGCSDADFIPQFLDIAREIGPNKELALRCYKIIKTFRDDFEILDTCLKYITLCPRCIELSKLESIILYVYTRKGIPNICLNSCHSMVKKISDVHTQNPSFHSDMKSIVIYSWIKMLATNNYLVRPFLLDLSLLIIDDSVKWQQFKEEVINRWYNHSPYHDFNFDSIDYESSLIDTLTLL